MAAVGLDALASSRPMAGAGRGPGVWPCPGSRELGQLAVEAQMLSGTWRTGQLCQHPHSELFRLS